LSRSTSASPRTLPLLLLLLFFGSGCAALIYEIVWFQLLQLVIGSSSISLGILLGTFMGGMCLGSLALPRMISARQHPLKVYAILEGGIGLFALLILFGMPLVGGIYTAWAGEGIAGIVFRAVVAGTVDAGPSEVWQQGRFGMRMLEDGRFYEDLQEYTYQASYGSDRAIASKREAIVRTLAAYGKLYRFLGETKSREPFVKAFATATGKDNREEAEAQWQFYQELRPFAVDLVLSEERVRYMQDLNVSLGVQKGVLPYEQVCDMSMARDAVKLLG